MIRVAIESTVQEFRIADNCLKQFFRITGVGQITSAFSCNIDLFAQFFIFSNRWTSHPRSAAFSAANMPAAPPPITAIFFFIYNSFPYRLLFFFLFGNKISSFSCMRSRIR